MGWTQTSTRKHQIIRISVENAQKEKIKSKYMINPKILGTGGMSTVYSASLRSDPNTKAAIKVINKMKINLKVSEVEKEIQIMKKLDHPNIVKYIEYYENEYNCYIVMEQCSGIELTEIIKKKVRNNQRFTAVQAVETIGKVLEAMAYMHSKGVCHNGIKPSDIIVDKKLNIKIIDFGTSPNSLGLNKGSDLLNDYFLPPEIKDNKSATPKSDIWSLGVILYIMLVGRYPFKDDAYTFNDKLWKDIPEDAQSLIKKMLMVDTSERYTAKKWLEHSWIIKNSDIGNSNVKDNFDDSDANNSLFRSSSWNSDLKWTVTSVGLSQRMNSERKSKLKDFKDDFDIEDNDWCISENFSADNKVIRTIEQDNRLEPLME